MPLEFDAEIRSAQRCAPERRAKAAHRNLFRSLSGTPKQPIPLRTFSAISLGNATELGSTPSQWIPRARKYFNAMPGPQPISRMRASLPFFAWAVWNSRKMILLRENVQNVPYPWGIDSLICSALKAVSVIFFRVGYRNGYISESRATQNLKPGPRVWPTLPLLQEAGLRRRSSSRQRPTLSPSSGPRPSNGGRAGGCEYGRRLRTRAACCARLG